MISFWRRTAAKQLAAELTQTRIERDNYLSALTDAQAVVRQKVADIAGWQDHAAKLMTDMEHLRRENEHWRQAYERVLEEGKSERAGLVGHLVDLKREGFTNQVFGQRPVDEPAPLPPEIERAISMRDFDTTVARQNREYALTELRLRPDAVSDIAKEILAGELFDAYDDGEVVS